MAVKTEKELTSFIDKASIPWGDIGQDFELPATPYKDGQKVTKPE